MEINLSRDIIYRIIEKAKEFHCKEEVVIPEVDGELSEDDFMQILADHENDLTYQEVKEEINNLEPDQQKILVALMYVGRGDFDADEWGDSLAEAEEGWTTHTAQYLLAKPMIADYLEEGLVALGLNEEM